MKKEDFLLISNFYAPELTGIGKYNGELMAWLSTQGHQCSVVAPYPYYPAWQVYPSYREMAKRYHQEVQTNGPHPSVTIYRCPHYIPSKPTGVKRILSDFSFFISALWQVIDLLRHKKFTYVIAVAPSFQLVLLGLLYKRICGATLIYHIQDLQIDAAQELGMIKWPSVLRLMYKVEQLMLKHADYVSSISEGMIHKIKAKYDRSVILFPNWTDPARFYPMTDKQAIRNRLGLCESANIILYSGAIGEKQGLQELLQSAQDLRFREDIRFVICSSGPYYEKLVSLAADMQLERVQFMRLLSPEDHNQLLNAADVHLVLQKANTNDLMMPSKLTSIFSVGGLALVTANPSSSLYALISTHKMGYLTQQENRFALTSSILELVDRPPADLPRNARAYAENYLFIDKVIPQFLSQITR